MLATLCSCGGKSLVGKWRATDMKMDGNNDAVIAAKVKEQLAKENMVYEFIADSTYKISGNTLPASSGKYTVKGDMIISTGLDNKVDSMMIVKQTDKELDLRSPSEKMTVIMEKQ